MPSLEDSHAALLSELQLASYSSARLMKESLQAVSVSRPSPPCLAPSPPLCLISVCRLCGQQHCKRSRYICLKDYDVISLMPEHPVIKGSGNVSHLYAGMCPPSLNHGPACLFRGSRSAARWPLLRNACSRRTSRSVSAISSELAALLYDLRRSNPSGHCQMDRHLISG